MRTPVFGILLGFFAYSYSLLAIAATSILVGGTGASYPILEILIAEFQRKKPAFRIELVKPPAGSSAGVRAVLQGDFDVAISGRHLRREEEQQLAERAWVTSPLVFVTNGDVGIKDVTRIELAGIYRGERQNWPDGTPLRLTLRPNSDSDTMLIRSLSSELDKAVTEALSRPGMVIATHDLENSEILSKARGIFGLITLCQLRAQQKDFLPLTLDGIGFSAKKKSGVPYPLIKELLLVTRKESSPAVNEFVEFLYSPTARRILLKNDCHAVNL